MNKIQQFESKLPPQKRSNACLKAIKETEIDLGTTDAIDLLSNALPLIVERQKMINLALQESDSEGAALHAHKTLGSVRLYGTEKLENYLYQLKNKQVEIKDFANFRDSLSAEFDIVSSTVGEWLALHKEAC